METSKKLVEGIDFYYDGGYMVLTQQYHLEKGYCCGHACRNCPYNFECVPEPKRSIALEMRAEAAENLNT